MINPKFGIYPYFIQDPNRLNVEFQVFYKNQTRPKALVGLYTNIVKEISHSNN